MATFCPTFWLVLWTWELCVDLAIYFWKSYLLNILYEKRIKVVFVLTESAEFVCGVWSQTCWTYERFLMQLAWELLTETHHRLEQGLCPNVFTANYIVASTACVKSILKTKIPLLLMIHKQCCPCCCGLSRRVICGLFALWAWNAWCSLRQNQFKRIKAKARDYQHL